MSDFLHTESFWLPVFWYISYLATLIYFSAHVKTGIIASGISELEMTMLIVLRKTNKLKIVHIRDMFFYIKKDQMRARI